MVWIWEVFSFLLRNDIHLYHQVANKIGPGLKAKPFIYLAPRDGLEPPTKWLTATRSTS
jgi:hypothetical protein